MKKENLLKKDSGITLIALIGIILGIILIIGIAIFTVITINQNNTIEKIMKKNKSENKVVAISENKNTVIYDDLGNEVTIPSGFGLALDSGTNITEGIVIEEAGIEGGGNQFVWIPVGETKDQNGSTNLIKLGRYKSDLNKNIVNLDENKEESKHIKELTVEEKTNEADKNISAKDIKDFINKVNNTGGYYIGRYEASNNNGKAEIKYDKAPWCSLTQKEAATLSNDMYSSNENFTSDLINSYAWDTAIMYIQTYAQNNYIDQTTLNNSILNTGKSGDMQLKITDIASNNMEWSTETAEYKKYSTVARGGDFYNVKNSANHRLLYFEHSNYTNISFRTILYL